MRPPSAFPARRVSFPILLALAGAAWPVPRDGEAEALAAAERALEEAPEDPGRLEAAGMAALAAGEPDLGLWYLGLAREAAPADAALAKRIAETSASVARPAAGADALLAGYAENLFKIAKVCEGKKLYANAVDLLGQCKGTRFAAGAAERLEKIYAREKAVELLLATGLDVPARAAERRSARELARLDAQHADWEDAYEVKGTYYTVRTNMGFEMAQAISDAMEQMNSFYRQVFDYKERGGTMRRCVIHVYRSRADFDAHEDVAETVKGFYRPLENSVTTYDPRTERHPAPLAALWSTLFHEASHQFTHAVWPNPIPTWLNEGTASYFEGARLQPGGTVAFNGIPDGRLKGLLAALEEGSPTVEQVITHFADGSYPGEYYPVGWGLVYFCHNYEDESAERVYLPIYRAFQQTYKGGGQHDVKGRFVEHFVTKAKVEGVASLGDFAALFARWIRALAAIHFGGAEQADVLIERGRRQTTHKKLAAAIESYRWALRKRPGDAVALAELAAARAAAGEADGALYSWRRLAERARGIDDPAAEIPGFAGKTAGEVLALAAAGIAAVDAKIAADLAAADAALTAAASAAARAWADAGLPRNAAQILATAQAVKGSDGTLAALARELAPEVDLRRWRRLAVEPGLEAWHHGDDWTAADGAIALDTAGLVFCVARAEPPPAFRYEVVVEPGEAVEAPIFGLVYGANPATGERLFALLPSLGYAGRVEFVAGVPELTMRFPLALPEGNGPIALALEVQPGRVEFFVNGASLGADEGGAELAGRVGIFGQAMRARFAELRVKY
ncbi:MAG: hypothetical protein AB1726_04105 [Planctomycetota bacterium]